MHIISSQRAWPVSIPTMTVPCGLGAMTVSVQPPSENACSMLLLTTALSARAPSTPPTHCMKMYTAAREKEMRPTSAAENVMTGLMWPPETGFVAMRRIATTIATRIDKTRFAAVVLVSMEEITIVSIAKTSTAVPTSSARDALHT